MISMARQRKRRTSSIANALTRAVVGGKKIETYENEKGTIDIWIVGEYVGWLDKDLVESILSRDDF